MPLDTDLDPIQPDPDYLRKVPVTIKHSYYTSTPLSPYDTGASLALRINAGNPSEFRIVYMGRALDMNASLEIDLQALETLHVTSATFNHNFSRVKYQEATNQGLAQYLINLNSAKQHDENLYIKKPERDTASEIVQNYSANLKECFFYPDNNLDIPELKTALGNLSRLGVEGEFDQDFFQRLDNYLQEID